MEERIHKFYLNGKYIVLDIPSGSVHIVDQAVYKIIDDFKDLTRTEILSKYKDEFPLVQLEEAYDEVKFLVDEEMLFTEDAK